MGVPYAEVIGDPIAHSKSPLIHNFWLEKLGIEARFKATLVSADVLSAHIASVRNDPDWLGCSVTMPLKAQALELADQADPLCLAAGSANLLVREGNFIIARNTDVEGVLSSLPEPLLTSSQEVCIFGTGGGARAALAACKRRDVKSVRIVARNVEAGERLLSAVGLDGIVFSFGGYHNLRAADVVINATPLGMMGQAPMLERIIGEMKTLRPKTVALDMVYDPLETDFLRTAREAGCRVVDGLEMLVGQAAGAFAHLFGRAAPREHDAELRALLRS